MQPAKLIDRLVPRPQIKMISITEDDRCSGLFEHLLRQSFDRALRADWHEGWSVKRPVRGCDAAGARSGGVVGCDSFE